jgi:general secretion pathway protein B
MSYILEALKKIERQRQVQETGPSLILADSEGRGPRPKSLWLYLVAIALLLNAGIMVWWLAHRGTTVARRPPAPRVSVASTTGPPPSAEVGRAIIPSKREAAPKPPPLVARAPAKDNRPPPPPAAEPKPVSAPVKAPPPAPLKKDIPRNDRVFNLSEIPADVRNALPPLKVSAHVYGPEPSSRMVQVNGQILQEGQGSTEGLKVEEILPNGVVFLFQGCRFRMGVQ